MSKLIPSAFARYELTDQEQLEGAVLNPLQEMFLQNELGIYAEQKLTLKYTPENSSVFIQEEAELQGKIILLQWIIATSEAAKLALLEQRSAGTQQEVVENSANHPFIKQE